jgi:hypothetical protein
LSLFRVAPLLFGVLALAGCGELVRCSDSPLGGTCTRIDGTWLLEASPTRSAQANCSRLWWTCATRETVGSGFVGREELNGVLLPDDVSS